MSLSTKLAAGGIPRTINTKQKYSDYQAALRTAIGVYMNRMSQWVKDNTIPRTVGKIPKATGYLAASAAAIIAKSKVTTHGFEAWAGYGAEYAKHADEGSVPHWPPIAPIITWCKTVGIPIEHAYAIQATIAKKGTEGKEFWKPTVAEAKAILRRELERAMNFYDLDVRVNIS